MHFKDELRRNSEKRREEQMKLAIVNLTRDHSLREGGGERASRGTHPGVGFFQTAEAPRTLPGFDEADRVFRTISDAAPWHFGGGVLLFPTKKPRKGHFSGSYGSVAVGGLRAA